MKLFMPGILMELLHKDGWHMNYDPRLCGQYISHDRAREELAKMINIMIDRLKDDRRYVYHEKVEPESELACVQVDVYYTDRCIMIKGYVYSGPITYE